MLDDSGIPAHSWRILILPYIDAKDLYDRYRFDEPWNGPNNSKLANEIPSVYQCPSFVNYHKHHDLTTARINQSTNYVAVVAANSVFSGDTPLRIKNITDGSSNTILVTEARHHSVHWMQPDDVTEADILFDLHSAIDDDQANHLGGLQCVFGDGTVRFISSTVDLATFHALITRNANDPIGDF